VCADSNSEAGIVLTDRFPDVSGNKMMKTLFFSAFFSEKLDYWIIVMKNEYSDLKPIDLNLQWVNPLSLKISETVRVCLPEC